MGANIKQPLQAEYLPTFAGTYFDSGRYLILESLGSGAYAKVYKCIDTWQSSPTHYAVKCMLRHPPGTRQYSYQQEELSLHGLVSYHPNVLTLHKVVYEHYYVYVLLQLCNGGDLSNLIFKHSAPLSDREIRRLFLQLLDAVMECHRRSVFHRDIKPENVLLSADKRHAYLADFGMATSLPHSSEFSCGSARYWAPENFNENNTFSEYPTAANDIWSLGVTLVNMVIGKDPWASPSHSDPHFSAFMTNPDHFLSILPISNSLKSLLLRVFCLKPYSRISLEEFWRDILHMEYFHAQYLEPQDSFWRSKSLHSSYRHPAYSSASDSSDGSDLSSCYSYDEIIATPPPLQPFQIAVDKNGTHINLDLILSTNSV